MAFIKWSAFPAIGALATGDTLVGLRAGANVKFNALTLPWSPTLGGTGVANLAGSTITLGGALTTSGAFASTFTMTGITSVTFPTSGTLATTATASGIVNIGTANQLAYYATTGTAISGLASANNGLLATNGAGVPSISNTVTMVGQFNVDNLRLDGGTLSSTSGILTLQSPSAANMEIIIPTSGNGLLIRNQQAAGRVTINLYRNTSEQLTQIAAGLSSTAGVGGDHTFITSSIAGGNIYLRTTAGNALNTSGVNVEIAGSLTLGSALAAAYGGTGITALGTGVATALGQNVNGSGAISLTTSPAFVTPSLGAATATSLILTKVNGTEAANAVTANGAAGVITTSSLTTAAGSSYAITWTNSTITATTNASLTIQGGTNTVQNITFTFIPGAGTATLTIYNNTPATALNGTILIGYHIY